MGPVDRFLQLEAAGGVLLAVATCVALLSANSSWRDAYERLRDVPFHIGVAGQSIDVTLQFLVNDVLMCLFFFSVGLELRRELHAGQLSGLRRAALPCFAALGGMLVPAAIYLVMNRGDLARGWGIPMATDIAFALAVLALLGSRVTPGMRVFLLAVAIIDDIGAILVIAVFYSHGVELYGIGLAAIGIAAIVLLQRLGARRPALYVLPALAIWFGLLRAGLHPTLAGALVGLLTPAVRWYDRDRYLAVVAEADELDSPELRRAQRELSSPAERIERSIHPWVAFLIMPAFAFVNAGIDLRGIDLGGTPTLVLGIGLGLLVGKPLGIVLATLVSVRARLASLPEGLTWRGIGIVGAAGGIGFTVALFIAELAFGERSDLEDRAKVVVLLSSTIAAVGVVILGRVLLSRRH